MAIVAMIRMIATTINSSINEKPFWSGGPDGAGLSHGFVPRWPGHPGYLVFS
jgi:hypothetical protein